MLQTFLWENVDLLENDSWQNQYKNIIIYKGIISNILQNYWKNLKDIIEVCEPLIELDLDNILMLIRLCVRLKIINKYYIKICYICQIRKNASIYQDLWNKNYESFSFLYKK